MGVADGEARIVGDERAGADQDGVLFAAEKVDVVARPGRGDPFRVARTAGDLPVEAERRLDRDERDLADDVLGEGLVQGRVPLREQADRDVEAGLFEPADALRVDERIGVEGRNDHPPEPGGEDRVDARRGPAPVDAGLQSQVQRRPLGALSGQAQGQDLRVGLARSPVVAVPGEDPVADDDGADEGIGARPPPGLLGQAVGHLHPGAVAGIVHASRASTNSRGENS